MYLQAVAALVEDSSEEAVVINIHLFYPNIDVPIAFKDFSSSFRFTDYQENNLKPI